MKTILLTCLLLFVLAGSASAEPRWQFPTPGERTAADVASWISAVAVVGLDARASWQSPDRLHAFERQGERIGLTYAAVFAAKLLVHRKRPCAPACGADNPNYSFFSGHTAVACQAMGGAPAGWGIALCGSTGAERVAAGKHWLTDVLTGAGVGALISRWR